MSIERIAFLAMNPWLAPGTFHPLNYAVYRLHASLVTDPRFSGIEIRAFESSEWTLDRWEAEIEAYDPDLVCASAFVWSLPTLVEVLRRAKANRPERRTVIGGPSARPSNLRLPPYRGSGDWIDALALGEGEDTIRTLAAHPLGEPLERVPGLALPRSGDWVSTALPPDLAALESYGSPFQLGLAPIGATGNLEASRGCSIGCSFCQWGAFTRKLKLFSREYLEADLRAMQAAKASGIVLADAGLNLNAEAFRRLVAAEDAVGFIRNTEMVCEIFPRPLKRELLAFLDGARTTVGVGVQSLFLPSVEMNRPSVELPVLQHIVAQLAEVAQTTIEIIVGMPGDSPGGFWRTFEEVAKLPCSFRVYHYQVLPDAKLDHASPEDAIVVDPISLEVRSCRGWSARDLEQTTRRLGALAADRGGMHSRLWPLPASEYPGHPENGGLAGVSLWMFPNAVHEHLHRHRVRHPAGTR